MPITFNITPEEFVKQMNFDIDEINKMCVDTLRWAMLKAVGYAREMGKPDAREFTQRTGALRSSIGFQIYRDGQLVNENFVKSPPSKEKKKDGTPKYKDKSGEGLSTGQDYSEKLVKSETVNIVGVMVAGMHYAVYVENLYGYDVLAGATLRLRELVKKGFAETFKGTNLKVEIIETDD